MGQQPTLLSYSLLSLMLWLFSLHGAQASYGNWYVNRVGSYTSCYSITVDGQGYKHFDRYLFHARGESLDENEVPSSYSQSVLLLMLFQKEGAGLYPFVHESYRLSRANGVEILDGQIRLGSFRENIYNQQPRKKIHCNRVHARVQEEDFDIENEYRVTRRGTEQAKEAQTISVGSNTTPLAMVANLQADKAYRRVYDPLYDLHKSYGFSVMDMLNYYPSGLEIIGLSIRLGFSLGYLPLVAAVAAVGRDALLDKFTAVVSVATLLSVINGFYNMVMYAYLTPLDWAAQRYASQYAKVKRLENQLPVWSFSQLLFENSHAFLSHHFNASNVDYYSEAFLGASWRDSDLDYQKQRLATIHDHLGLVELIAVYQHYKRIERSF